MLYLEDVVSPPYWSGEEVPGKNAQQCMMYVVKQTCRVSLQTLFYHIQINYLHQHIKILQLVTVQQNKK